MSENPIAEANERQYKAQKLVEEERRRQKDAELLAQKEVARLARNAEKIPAELGKRNKLDSKISYKERDQERHPSKLDFVPDKLTPNLEAKPMPTPPPLKP